VEVAGTGSANDGEEAMGFNVATELEIGPTKAIEVFAELVDLLEDYGPTWYSQDLHDQAEAAVRVLREHRHTSPASL
jgi:hypothetical protein